MSDYNRHEIETVLFSLWEDWLMRQADERQGRNRQTDERQVNNRQVCHRQDMSDTIWRVLEPHIPARYDKCSDIAGENRRFVDAVFQVMRSGAPWRALSLDYGHWTRVHQRFIRWRDSGVWDKLLELLIDQPGYEWLMTCPNGGSAQSCTRNR